MPMLSASYAKLLLASEVQKQKNIVCELKLKLSNPTADNLASMGQSLGLTKREIQIVQCIADSLNSKAIGQQLSISPWTVKNHLQSIYGKVGVNTRIGLLKRLNRH